ncbi:hypothetical protein NHH03_13830 [Stieleria sp. TO1_6]|uniref:hypothetical protein n=1 Tax=Stieleria tagensis TaxID=2956795 RepID=UPI00209B0149|nr:hypothetical protein [Stieleria tagensis]MCO8122823.1 hypothetical protein [Stieleria tagensis]
MRRLTRLICTIAIASAAMLSTPTVANAQYPAYYAPVLAPSPVVGYTARRRGLFGRRVVVRPLVAPSVVTYAPLRTYFAPAVPVAVPVTTYRVDVPAYRPVYGY